MFDAGVSARPDVQEMSIQAEPEVVECGIQSVPESCEVSIDATPVFAEAEVMAVAEYHEMGVDAVPPTEEKAIEPSDTSSEDSDDVVADTSIHTIFTPTAAVTGIFNITTRVVRFYTAPIRFVFSFVPFTMPPMPMPFPKIISPASSLNLELKHVSEKQPTISVESSSPRANGTAVVDHINPVCS